MVNTFVEENFSRSTLGGIGRGRDPYETTPLGRVSQPGEIAQLVAFLASDESSYCTGSEFIADGGMLAGI